MQKKHPWLIEVGKNIRKVREAKGFSQEQLASLAGLDRTYVGGIERGERNVAIINLINIAIVLDIEVAVLFSPLANLQQIARDDSGSP